MLKFRIPFVMQVSVGLLALATAIGILYVLVFESTPFEVFATTMQSIVTTAAIFTGGVIAYRDFNLFRKHKPHLTVSQLVSLRQIGEKSNHIAVISKLVNGSSVVVQPDEIEFSVQQVSPISNSQLDSLVRAVFDDGCEDHLQWPVLQESTRNWKNGDVAIEPGESHQEVAEFVIPNCVRSVLICTHVSNPEHPNGPETWNASTFLDLE